MFLKVRAEDVQPLGLEDCILADEFPAFAARQNDVYAVMVSGLQLITVGRNVRTGRVFDDVTIKWNRRPFRDPRECQDRVSRLVLTFNPPEEKILTHPCKGRKFRWTFRS